MSEFARWSDDKLKAAITRAEAAWDRLSSAMDECGGRSGSPMESLDEELGALHRERERRALKSEGAKP
jgi:hypothetical protein